MANRWPLSSHKITTNVCLAVVEFTQQQLLIDLSRIGQGMYCLSLLGIYQEVILD